MTGLGALTTAQEGGFEAGDGLFQTLLYRSKRVAVYM